MRARGAGIYIHGKGVRTERGGFFSSARVCFLGGEDEMWIFGETSVIFFSFLRAAAGE